MSIEFLRADHPGVVATQPVDRLPDGALRSLPGNTGCVFYGPQMAIAAGVYRFTAKVETPADGAPLYWDIYAEGRVYAGQEFTGSAGRLIAHVPDHNLLEFRFTTRGSEFVYRGVEIEPVLLDVAPVDRRTLVGMIETLIAERADPEAIFHLVDRLSLEGHPADAERLRTTYVAGQGRVAAKIRALAIELNTPGAPVKDPGFRVDPTYAEVADALSAVDLTQVFAHPQNFHPVTAEDRKELTRRGYQPDFIHATRTHRSTRFARRPWQRGPQPGGATGITPRRPMFEGLANTDLSFQPEIATDGMVAYCPVSGRKLTSTHGFCHHTIGLPQIVYRFEGVEVFYIFAGGFSGGRLFMYLPRTSLIVGLEEPVLRWYNYHAMAQEFLANLVFYWREVKAYLKGPTKPAAVLGLNNIGHFFWNDLAGLQYALDSGVAGRLKQIVKVRKQYLDYEALFPELASKPSLYVEQPLDVFAHFLKNRLRPIRFTDGRISPQMFQRLRRAVAERASPNGKPPADAPRPLLWVNLRLHNKVWVSQAEGYANILNAVYEDYGAASALLDGTPDCAGLAEEIRRKVRPEVQLYDGLHLSVYDSLSWAGEVDAYLSVTGAALTLLTWLTDARGVAHSEHGHMEHLTWWSEIRPEAPKPLSPEFSEVTELGSGWHCNYDVDWRVLYRLLRQVLDQTMPARRSAGGAGEALPG
jgi:hypothetical protein